MGAQAPGAAGPGLVTGRMLHEGGRVIALVDEPAFASEGDRPEDALGDLVLSIREYAEDWHSRLHAAPNHASAAALVLFADDSTDTDLLEMLGRDLAETPRRR